MRVGLKDYLWAAFNARPWGMLLPPNWLMLAGFALAGAVLNPGFWLLGAGVELAYLLAVGLHPRFQKVVDGRAALRVDASTQQRFEQTLAGLSPEHRLRFRQFQDRCRQILQEQARAGNDSTSLVNEETFGRLLLIYLRLLAAGAMLDRVVRDDQGLDDAEPLEVRIRRIQKQLQRDDLSEALRNSLSGQLEILQQRTGKQREAADKIQFIESELARVEQQVELLREMALVPTAPETLSARIDQVSQTLSQTSQWIQDQQRLYGVVDDLLTDSPGDQAALLRQ